MDDLECLRMLGISLTFLVVIDIAENSFAER